MTTGRSGKSKATRHVSTHTAERAKKKTNFKESKNVKPKVTVAICKAAEA